MMDGNGSFALDLKLYLADVSALLERHGTAPQTLPTNVRYVIFDVVYKICLIKLYQIVTDEND